MKGGRLAQTRRPRPGGAKAGATTRPSSGPRDGTGGRSVGDLLHELQVHQIELEMQNEELRRARLALEESRDWYLDLFEFAPIGYFTLTREAAIAGVNMTGATLLGVPRSELITKRFAGFVAPEDADLWGEHLVKVLMAKTTQVCELRLVRADGTTCSARLDSIRMDRRGAVAAIRTAVTDVTERKQAEHELRIAAIAFETQEGIVITDSAARIQRVNRALTELTGYSAAEAIGHLFPFIAAVRLDDAFYRRLWKTLKTKRYWQGEIAGRRKDGEALPMWLTASAVADPDGEVTNYVFTLADITPHKEAEARIHRLAFYDPLTQLPNRRLLHERLGQALATSVRSRRHGVILFIDLDNFKSINDTKGHDVGDQLLVKVAERLLSCVRECDTVARLGGDEFVVMLEHLSCYEREAASQAEGVAEKVRRVISRSYRIDGKEYHSTPSIGISLFRNASDTVEELLKRADVAMYRAKTSGRNNIRFFDPAMQLAVEARATLESDLRRALARGQLELHFQMQVDGNGRTAGAEALLRWRHPTGGLVVPAQFIEVAEETGLIVPIGLWVLERACAQIKEWERSTVGRGIHLAVNVSAHQFRQRDFVERVREVLKRTGVDPTRLKLEFTESMLLDNVDDTIARMQALKHLGIGFCMDDFGTGYSSLAYLKRLPLDQLKIDQSFVRDIASDPSDAVIVETILAMARTLGLGVIAEGVETEEQLDLLTRRGCSLFQGYLFGRPAPLSEFERAVDGGARASLTPA